MNSSDKFTRRFCETTTFLAAGLAALFFSGCSATHTGSSHPAWAGPAGTTSTCTICRSMAVERASGESGAGSRVSGTGNWQEPRADRTTPMASSEFPIATTSMFAETVGFRPTAPAHSDGAANIHQVTFVAEGAVFNPEADPTGERIVFASTMHNPRPDIYVKSANGTTVTQLTSDPASDIMPCFSQDGNTIAFASDRSGNYDIYIMPIDGGRPMQLTFDGADEMHPSIAPDGKTLAYCTLGQRSGQWEIWTVDITNPGVRNFLTYGMFPQWNPDADTPKLLFQRSRKRGSRYHSIWTIDYADGEAVRPTEIVAAANAAVINPCWSPDGTHIAFVTINDPGSGGNRVAQQQHTQVWMTDLQGTNRVNLTSAGSRNFEPVWAGSGLVYFVSDRSGTDNLWAVAVNDANQPITPESDRGLANVDDQNR